MGRRAKVRITEASRVGATVTDAPAVRAVGNGVEPPVAALIALAEELGRLLARRELAKIRDRRAYVLPETLLGASVVAFVLILLARALGWLAH